MPPLRPIGHEDRLSLVEHLDELRTRLIWSIAVFAVAFAFCYWQNGEVLTIVNRPVVNALKPGKHPQDQLGQTTLFQQRVGALAKALGPALGAVQRSAATPADKQALAGAIAAARATAVATPTSTARRPVTFGVTEPFLTTFKIAGYAAILLTLPFLLYQLYAFILPAFTPRERSAVFPLLLMIPALFAAGVAFGYFVALPRAASFLLTFNQKHFDILLRAQDYYSFTITLLAAIGLVFQVPIGVLALTRLGIISPSLLRKNRGYVVLGTAIVAAVVTPTPDPVTMLITMAPILVLFELSILLASLLERRRAASAADDVDSDWT
jgi:sec-independent protein translocase protein TatC